MFWRQAHKSPVGSFRDVSTASSIVSGHKGKGLSTTFCWAGEAVTVTPTRLPSTRSAMVSCLWVPVSTVLALKGTFLEKNFRNRGIVAKQLIRRLNL